MYEDLIAFLLGRKEELSDDDLNEFIDLLNLALETTEEYDILEKTVIVDKMVDKAKISDAAERVAVSQAIGNILQFEDSEGEDIDIFKDTSEKDTPLRSRKLVRGKFNRSNAEKKVENKVQDDLELKNDEYSTINIPNSVQEVSEPLKKSKIAGFEDYFDKEVVESTFKQTFNNDVFSMDGKTNDDSENKFIFDIGELEDRQIEGPEVFFDLDDKQ